MSKEEFIVVLRNYLLDKPELNVLNLQVEILDSEVLGSVVDDAVADYNTTLPLTSLALEQANDGELFVIKLGAVIRALDRYMLLNAHNREDYVDQGFVAQEYNRLPLYMQIRQLLQGEYEEKKRAIKMSSSMAAAFGGVHSVYGTNG